MFKRIKALLTRPKTAQKKGHDLPVLPGSKEELDPDGYFIVSLPIRFKVENSPLATFSERAVRGYRKESFRQLQEIKQSIFYPMDNGKLRVFPPTPEEKDKKRRN